MSSAVEVSWLGFGYSCVCVERCVNFCRGVFGAWGWGFGTGYIFLRIMDWVVGCESCSMFYDVGFGFRRDDGLWGSLFFLGILCSEILERLDRGE